MSFSDLKDFVLGAIFLGICAWVHFTISVPQYKKVLGDLRPYVNDESHPDWVKDWICALFFVGLTYAAYIAMRELSVAAGYLLRWDQDLLAKYGKKDGSTYALVTGGSDGIGLQICNQLAGKGFNIIMMSN